MSKASKNSKNIYAHPNTGKYPKTMKRFPANKK